MTADAVFFLILDSDPKNIRNRNLRGFCLFIFVILSLTIGKKIRSNTISAVQFMLLISKDLQIRHSRLEGIIPPEHSVLLP